jgi:hypothetical protein
MAWISDHRSKPTREYALIGSPVDGAIALIEKLVAELEQWFVISSLYEDAG